MGDKKIEEGCIAITLIRSENPNTHLNAGKIVKVGKFLKYVEGFSGGDYWEVDQIMVASDNTKAHIMSESFLRRLDSNEELKTKQRETIKEDQIK